MPSALHFEKVYRREADPHVEYTYRVEVRLGPPATWSAAIQRNGEFMGTAAGTITHPPSDPALLEALADSEVTDIIETRFSVL